LSNTPSFIARLLPSLPPQSRFATERASRPRGYRMCSTNVEAPHVAAVKLSATLGNPDSLNTLGEWSRDGTEGITQDLQMAIVLFRNAASQNHPPALNNLGNCYCQGDGVTEDYVAAADLFRKAALLGYAPAQANLGACYREGAGVTADFEQSMLWFKKAAEQGHLASQNNLAGCLLTGEDGHTVIDAPQAVMWLQKAVQQGSRDAQSNLAEVLVQGAPGVSVDLPQAAGLFRKAAKAGDSAALWNLGMLYMMGQGVEKDAAFACKCWFKAAKEGETRAMSCLGIAYQQGEGVEKDMEKGEAWMRKSHVSVGGTDDELPLEFQAGNAMASHKTPDPS